MENTVTKSETKRKWHRVKPTGKWELTYTPTNPMNNGSFGGYHLGAYDSPYDQRKVLLRNQQDQAVKGYLVAKLKTVLKPDERIADRHLISWMICHPEVKLEGIPAELLDPQIQAAKVMTKITLKWVDAQQLNDIEEEDFIDRLVGHISEDSGRRALSIKKIRYIMAAVGMRYREPRYTGEAEKKYLRSVLKKAAKSSIKKAKDIQDAIDNLDESKEHFNFLEMIRTGVISEANGIFKFGSTSLGTSERTVKIFFEENPDVKAEMVRTLYEILDNE